MQLIRNIYHCPEAARGSVLALGNFDGVHLGHQHILKECLGLAQKQHALPAVMTFQPHPRAFFAPDKKPVAIYNFRQKWEGFAACGIKTVFAAHFNARLAQMSAQDFIEHVLHQSLGCAHVLTGYNFAFGKDRQGTPELLAREAKRLGFGYTAIDAITKHGETVSTSAIRDALTAGNLNHATSLLGRPYHIEGHVIHGQKRGKTIGFPTANIHVGRLYTPRFGVYSVRAYLKGKHYHGVANLGIRPTIGTKDPLLEIHLFDFAGSIYGQRLHVELLEFIRTEQKFPDLAALTTQIQSDVQEAKKRLLHTLP